MDKAIAFIGTGYMGSAIIRAACVAIDPKQIIVTDSVESRAVDMADEVGCLTASGNIEAAMRGDCIMLCVKPQVIASVLREISPVLKPGYEAGNPKILYSIAAGVDTDTIRKHLKMPEYPIIRIMPNTPAQIGKGLMLLGHDDTVSQEAVDELKQILSGCGNIEMLDEKLFDQATVSSSCSPAFVYMFIEALADGGVSIGLSRAQAQAFAANAVLGAAAMVLETGMHPGELKDMVCSPGGSTIAGVAELEAGGFRGAVIDAVKAAFGRNIELGRES